ncbi:hypothetical protein C2G38_2242329 [Gigaspora rosea]|uniref:Uncharacterized protein n=1 Tax=Gigaspora rosea TaxID=44941 RepID=A0A397VSG7_9GLOM|nr:hypothetical protein C2G38_2242329 [Gigaspora rosea]
MLSDLELQNESEFDLDNEIESTSNYNIKYPRLSKKNLKWNSIWLKFYSWLRAEPLTNPSKLYCEWCEKAKFNNIFTEENNIATFNIQDLCSLVEMQIQNKEEYIISTSACTIRLVFLNTTVLEEKCKYGPYSNIMLVSKCLVNNIPCYRYLGMIQLTSGTANSITSELLHFFTTKNIPTKALYHIGSDGARKINGVAAKLKEIYPFLTEHHCILHCLVLAGKDAAKKIIEKDSGDPELVLLQIVTTRWLSFSNVVKNLHQIINSVVEALLEDSLTDKMAKFLHSEIDNNFYLATYYLADILGYLRWLTLLFQANYISLFDIKLQLNATINAITTEFIEVPLFVQDFAKAVIESLKERFPDHDLIDSFRILDPKELPTDKSIEIPAIINGIDIKDLLQTHVGETIEQYPADMASLFRQVTVERNQYHESMKAQIFVQGLRPDLALAIRLFMPRTLQEAIKRARQSANRMNQSILTNLTKDPLKKLILLIKESVVLVKNNNYKTREIYNVNRDESIIKIHATKQRKGNDSEATKIKMPESSKEESEDHPPNIVSWQTFLTEFKRKTDQSIRRKIEEESILDEEAGSESKKKEYKDKSFNNETYFYMKLQKVNDEPKICEICSKVDHDNNLCIFKKNQEIETVNYIKERRVFNLDPLTRDQEVKIENLLEKYKDVFKKKMCQLGRTTIIQYEIIVEGSLPIKQRFYTMFKPKYVFINTEICE